MLATLAARSGATATGSVTAAVHCVPGGSPPSASTGAATGMTTTAATVHADVNPSGCTTQYHFEYGTTVAYGNSTVTRSAGSGTSPKVVASRIAGLAADTIYHFRIVATSAAGTTNGPDQTFRTLVSCAPGGTLPSITHIQVTGATQTGVILHATVSPNGCTTSYQFAYGHTTGYAHRTRIVQVASASGPISASETIRGLTPNTKYHLSVFAYSARGKTAGPDLTFRTKLASAVRIAPGPAYLDTPFVAEIRLSCVHGGGSCAGAVKIFSVHRLIGRHRFFLRRGRTALILVGLDRLGRALLRAQPAVRVEVVAHLRYYKTTRVVTLVRRFTVRTR